MNKNFLYLLNLYDNINQSLKYTSYDNRCTKRNQE